MNTNDVSEFYKQNQEEFISQSMKN
jgi:hypothetical protein